MSSASPDPVREAVHTYTALHPALVAATEAFVELVTRLLDGAGINYLSVTGRTKSVKSFAAKAGRTASGRLLYADPLAEITDQIGVRVVTYVHSDVAAVADLLADEMVVLADRDLGQETASEGQFGYSSRHLLITPDPARAQPDATAYLVGRSASVQVRTVLQHAWAEFEHDIRYKGTVPQEHVVDFDRRFTLAAGLLELADREFTTIRERLRATVGDQHLQQQDSDPRIDAKDLATLLDSQYAEAGWSRTEHYAWIAGLLLELGITSVDELATVLARVDEASLQARMAYKYPAGAVRRLDDALLAEFGERYVGLHGNQDRVDLLSARLRKLHGVRGGVQEG